MAIIGYDIIPTKKDKDKSRYDPIKNIVYTRQLPLGYKYLLEASNYNPKIDDYDRFFILSRTEVDEQCRNVEFDDFGRYKIRPVAHREYLATYCATNTFDIVLHEHQTDYDVYILP